MGQLRERLSECSLPDALEAMGERWSFLILRASFNGLHHFEEFQQELGIARNILSNRLTRMVGNGILKSIVFGITVTYIALLQGHECSPTPEGVAHATTRTVVIASLAVLGLDFLLTALMFSI